MRLFSADAGPAGGPGIVVGKGNYMPQSSRSLSVCVVACVCAVVALVAAAPAPAAPPQRCGSVQADGATFKVRASNNLGCNAARRVVRFVLTHGQPTQGSPGTAPAGWSCGYSFGTSSAGLTARTGPACEMGSKLANGYEKGFKPL